MYDKSLPLEGATLPPVTAAGWWIRRLSEAVFCGGKRLAREVRGVTFFVLTKKVTKENIPTCSLPWERVGRRPSLGAGITLPSYNL